MPSGRSLYEDLSKLFVNLIKQNNDVEVKPPPESETGFKDLKKRKAKSHGFQTLLFKDPHLGEVHSSEMQLQALLFQKRISLYNDGHKLDSLIQHFEDTETLEHYLPVLMLLLNVKPVIQKVSKKKREDLVELMEISSQDKQEFNSMSSCQVYKSFGSNLFEKPPLRLLEDPSAVQIQSEFTRLKYINELDVAHRGLFGALTNPPKSLDFFGISSCSRFILALDDCNEDKINVEEPVKEDLPQQGRIPSPDFPIKVQQDPWENLENLTDTSKEMRGTASRSPFLCHAPLDRMEELYIKYEENLKLVDSGRLRTIYKVSEQVFRDSVKYLLCGIESHVFPYCDDEFHINGSPIILGLTPDCLSEAVAPLVECGRLVKRLNRVLWQTGQGFVRNALAIELQNMLKTHDELIEMVMDSSSLIAIIQGTKTLLPSIRLLDDLWHWPGWDRPAGSGVGFLQYLVNRASASIDSIERDLCSGYFISCARPFLTFLSNWIYRGECCDPFREFLISTNGEFLEKRDRSYWTDGFSLEEINREEGPFVGSTIDDDAIHGLYADIYLCGKTVNLLKLCHGTNNFDQGPSLRIAVSLAELKSVRSECSDYALKIPPEVQFFEPPKRLGKIAQAVRDGKLAQLIAEKQARDRLKLEEKLARNVAARAELDEQLELKRAEQRRQREEDRLLDEDIKLYQEMVDRRDAKEKQRLLLKYAQLLSDQPTDVLDSQDELNANETAPTDNQNNILALAEAKGTNSSTQKQPKPAEDQEAVNNNHLNYRDDASHKDVVPASKPKASKIETRDTRKPRRKEPIFLTREAIKAKVLLEEFGIDPRCDVQPEEIIVGKATPGYQPSSYIPKDWNIPPTESYTKHFSFKTQNVGLDREESAENDWTQLCRPESKEIFNLSLSFFVQRSLLLPVRTQCQMVNRSLMALLIGNEHRLMKHLDTLRQFLFLDNGPFSYSLARSIGQRLGQLTHAHQLVNVPSMSFVLQTALNAVHADEHYASRLSFYVKESPALQPKSHFDVLDCFTLRYRVEWPLNLILTEEIMDSYSQIFSFVLQVRLAAWSMQDVFVQMMKLNSDAWLPIHGARQGIEFFVHTMLHYVMSQLLSLAWNDFVNELKKSARSLDDLYNIHANYVHRAKARLLLTAKSASLMKIIRDALGLSLKFRSILLAANFRHSPQLQAQVCSVHNKAKEYAKFIRLILEKASDRTQQPHLLELLLKLNYNQFYN